MSANPMRLLTARLASAWTHRDTDEFTKVCGELLALADAPPPEPPAGLDTLLDALTEAACRFSPLNHGIREKRQAIIDYVAALSRPDRDGEAS